MSKGKPRKLAPETVKHIKDVILQECIMDNVKESLIQKAEDLWENKDECMKLLTRYQLDSAINYRRPILDDSANAALSLSAAFLELRVGVHRGVVTVTLENTFKRHHQPRTVYEGKWEDI